MEPAEQTAYSQARPVEIGLSTDDFIKKRYSRFHDDYTYLSDISRGVCQEVIQVQHKLTGDIRAAKVLNNITEKADETRELHKEIEFLKKLQHPNVIKIYEYYETEDSTVIIEELCTGGNVLDKITENSRYTEKQAAEIIKQVLSAVEYCHLHKIVHRDIRPQNILFETKEDNSVIKLANYTYSTVFDPNKHMKIAAGTPLYMAPEMLKKDYDEKCDIWACGVTLYNMLSGEQPFKGKNTEDILMHILEGKYKFDGSPWKKISKEAKEFIKKLLSVDVKQRYSAEEALTDPWIAKFTVDEDCEALEQEALTNLRSFRTQARLQEAFWTFIASYCGRASEKEVYLKAFKKLDKNGDGVLSKDELKKGFNSVFKFGCTEKDIDEIMARADLDRDGVINYNEFLALAIDRKKFLDKTRLEAAFKLFDEDGNGYLTIGEIKDFLNPEVGGLKDETWRALIEEIDKNKDGKISYAEFKEMMVQLIDGAP